MHWHRRCLRHGRVRRFVHGHGRRLVHWTTRMPLLHVHWHVRRWCETMHVRRWHRIWGSTRHLRRHWRHGRRSLGGHRCWRRCGNTWSLSSATILLCDHLKIRNRISLDRVLCPSRSTAGEDDVFKRKILSGDDFLDLAVEDGVGRLLESDLDGHAGEVGHRE